MSCNITGTLYTPDGSVLANSGVLFEVLTDGAARTAVHVPYKVQSFFTTDDTGLLDADIETPSSGSWQYRMTIHENGATYDFYLASTATALTIDEVLALAGQAGSEAGTPQGEMLLGIYTDAQTAVDGQVLTSDGAGGTAWENVPSPDLSGYATAGDLSAHTGNTSNPHGVTAAQAGADPAGTAATAVAGHESTYIHLSSGEAAWVTAGKTAVADGADLVDANDLGTAAYAATGDFDAAGSAAAAQAASVQRANHTGTQLLNTISDVTATGSSLAKAATVDVAREVLGLAAVALPPISRNHHTMTWATSNVVGSFAASNYLNFCSLLVSGGTANSSGSIRVNDTALSLNYTAGTVNFARKINLSLYLRRGTANAQGVAYWTIGKVPSAAHGLVASGDYIGIKIENQTITSLVYCVSGTISTIAVSAAISAIGTMVFITSNNGSITWYADGAEIGSSASGPTANTYGTIFAEIQNGATAANYTMSIISSSEGF